MKFSKFTEQTWQINNTLDLFAKGGKYFTKINWVLVSWKWKLSKGVADFMGAYLSPLCISQWGLVHIYIGDNCWLFSPFFVSAQKADKNYVITQGGNLPCKNIMHFVSQDDIKSLVSQVLQECDRQQYTSVALPAIGTGLCLPFLKRVRCMWSCWSQDSSDEFDLSEEVIIWWKFIWKYAVLKSGVRGLWKLISFTPYSDLVHKEHEFSKASTSLLTGIQKYVCACWRTCSLVCVGSS